MNRRPKERAKGEAAIVRSLIAHPSLMGPFALGRLFGRGLSQRAFLQQAVQQSAEGVFIFQLGIYTVSGNSTYKPGAVDHHHLRNAQYLFSTAAQVGVDGSFIRVAHGIGKLEIVDRGLDQSSPAILRIGRIEDDANRLKSAWGQLSVELV